MDLVGFPEEETILHHQTLQTGHTKPNWAGRGGLVVELSRENSSEP